MTQTTELSNHAGLVHILAADQFDRSRIESVLDDAQALLDVRDQRLAGKIAATLFFEPSTRTRLSFESAMLRLGGAVIGSEAAAEFSSTAKGETLEDTISVVAGYADVIVLRHPDQGAARRAAAVSTVPVINAGDGAGEHPTQALLDLFCMRRELGRLDDLDIALCGDLRFGRTIHSLVRMLAHFNNIRFRLIAPDAVQMDRDLIDELRAAGVACDRASNLDEVAPDVDVVYQTRVQKERFHDPSEYAAARGAVRVNSGFMERLGEHAIVMHPLPRIDEIAHDVDTDPRAAYFRQAHGGVAVRMALLELVLR